jgi:hypothetical protein
VIIKVKDLTDDPDHQPNQTIFNLRVEGSPIIETTDPVARSKGKESSKSDLDNNQVA